MEAKDVGSVFDDSAVSSESPVRETARPAAPSLRTWMRVLFACVVWFGLIAAGLSAMYRASIPAMPAVVKIEAAASQQPADALSPLSVDSDWQPFELPVRVCQVRCESLFTVYRHRFELTTLPATDWAVYLPFFDANVAVYLNGEKVDERGRMLPPADVYRFHSRLVRLSATRLRQGENTLIVQLLAERKRMGSLAPFYVGPVSELQRAQRWRQRLTEDTVAGVGWLQAGSLLLALAMLLSGRRDDVLGWYLVCGSFWLLLIVLHVSPTALPGGNLRWATMFLSVFGVLAFTPLFIVAILRPPWPWLRRGLIGYFIACVAITFGTLLLLPVDPDYQLWVPNSVLRVSTLLLVPLMLWLVLRVVLARGDSRASAWILAFAAMPGVFGVADAIRVWRFPPLEFALLPLGGLGVSLALFLELARRMRESQRRMASYTAELEQTVRVREEALRVSYERIGVADRERALADERQRLLRDMHDGVGGQLASLVHLAGNPDTSRDQVVAGLRDGLADLRLVLDSLAHDEDDGIVALGRLRHRIEPILDAAAIRLHWEIDPQLDLPVWKPESVLNIYRLLQEATYNAVRHAQARNLTIRGREVDRTLEFSVADDGIGIDPEAVGGFGMASLKARAARLGGELQVESQPGQGTQVVLRVPLAPFDDAS
jgi:signal transduction histidine kinase